MSVEELIMLWIIGCSVFVLVAMQEKTKKKSEGRK